MWINDENPFEWTGGTNGDLKLLLGAVKAIASDLLARRGNRFAILVPWSERNCLVRRLNHEDSTLREMSLLARYRGHGDASNIPDTARIFIQSQNDARTLVRLPGVSPVSPDHLGERFKTVDELEQLRENRPDMLPGKRIEDIKVQCDDWHEVAVMNFQDLVERAGSNWQLFGEVEVDDGAYQVTVQSGFEPCVRVRGFVLSRKTEQRSVVLWYTWTMSFHQGFPNAA